MSRKQDKTGRSKGEGRFARVFHYMMKTPAWQALSPLASSIYLEVTSRYAGEATNNGRIGYSVREAAARFKVGKTTASRALQELQEKGFIVCTTKGGFSVKIRRATEWRLTEYRCDVTGEMPSREFMQWRPSVPAVGQKKQNTVPVAGRTVPMAGQHGTCSGTSESENSPDGTCGGTVGPQNDPLTVPEAGHIYICQGVAEQQEASSHHNSKRGRSALTEGAVASPRVPEPESPPAASLPSPHQFTSKATSQGESRTARNPHGTTASHLMETGLMKRALLKGEIR